jgi:hypothetical protein
MSFSPGLPHYVDSTMLSTLRACKRKASWSIIHALYPTGKSVHLIAGAAFAAGLEAARLYAFKPGVDCTHQDLLEAAFPAFLREWGEFEAPDGNAKSLVNTFSALGDYLEKHHPLADVVQPHIKSDGAPAVEFTFSIPLDGPNYPRHPDGQPFIFVGRFDMLGYFGAERLPVIVDEKTTSAIGYAWEQQWSLRGQFLGYVWAMQQLGFNLRHVLVRGIAINKTQYKTASALPMYSDHLISRWHSQLIRDLVELTETYKVWRERFDARTDGALLEGFWDMNLADACSSYGGCAFAGLCAAKRPQNFFNNYIRHRWDPLARNPVIELQPASREEEELPSEAQQSLGDPKCEPCSPPPVFSLSLSPEALAKLEHNLAPGAILREPSPPEPASSQSTPEVAPST